jgi:hypothetical protein
MTAREVKRQSETHPTLRARILNLQRLGSFSHFESNASAFSLIDNLQDTEQKLFSANRPSLTRATWDGAVLQKLLERWGVEVAGRTRRPRGKIDLTSLSNMCASLPQAADFLGFKKRDSDLVERNLWKAFVAALAANGWSPVWERGRLILQRNDLTIDPTDEILRLKTRQIANWGDRCKELGLTDVVLLPEVPVQPKGLFCGRCVRSFPRPLQNCPYCFANLQR